jgi:hypothetical protein
MIFLKDKPFLLIKRIALLPLQSKGYPQITFSVVAPLAFASAGSSGIIRACRKKTKAGSTDPPPARRTTENGSTDGLPNPAARRGII